MISNEFLKRKTMLYEKLKHREYVIYDNNLDALSGKLFEAGVSGLSVNEGSYLSSPP
jgi:hypothetical protein